MTDSQVYLGLHLFLLLFVDSFGLPAKGSQASSFGGSSTHEPNYVPHRRASSVQYSAPDIMSQPMLFYVQEPSLSQEVEVPAPDGMALVAPGESYPGSFSSSPVQEGYFLGSTQPEAAQPGLPESHWLVAPQSFEEASANSQVQSSSEFFPQPPLPPAGPVLQSGESSNIVKEAELGNYQQQTEEFGYPAQPAAPGPGFTRLPAQSVVLPGYWGNTYPGFDYRLLYGLYPPGTYSTFSQSHEKGKDYYKDVHYLKEHESEDDDDDYQGPYQQKIFPGPPQYSTGQQVASRV